MTKKLSSHSHSNINDPFGCKGLILQFFNLVSGRLNAQINKNALCRFFNDLLYFFAGCIAFQSNPLKETVKFPHPSLMISG